MIGKDGAELDIAKLDELCQGRKLQRLQNIRHNEIAGDRVSLSVPVSRPYGVEREGAAYDIWYHILNQETDPAEVKKLWEVSAMFRDILREKHIETRLPEIVKLILDKRSQYWDDPEVLEEMVGKHYKEWSDRRFRMLSFLNLRLISKQCSRSVEDICHSEKCYGAYIRLTTMEEVQRICQRLIADHPSIAESHFPGFVVSVVEHNGQGNLELFRQAVTDFLGLAGRKIQSFGYYPSREACRDSYNRLREWASFLPNMELFAFALNRRDYEDVPPLEDIEPFPALPRLRSIPEASANCAISCVLSSPFVQRILEACPGIQDLQLYEGDHESEHLPQQMLVETLSNLTSLRIVPSRALLLHRNLPWKLKKLYLGDPNMDFERTVASCLLFQFLKQFEETLEHLEFHDVDFFDCCGYLDLKNLEMLEVKLHTSYRNLNFLLYAEKLETLKIRVGDYNYTLTDEECRKIISRSFLGMSIWDVFPYLRRFKLCTLQYSAWNGNVSGTKIEEFRPIPQAL